MKNGLPEKRMCRRAHCGVWSWELAAGKPCPYCRKSDRSVRAWIWIDRIVVVATLAALASLVYLVEAI